MQKNPFDELELKPGAQWFTGEWVKRMIVALKKDRAIPAMGGGLQEMQGPNGRVIYVETTGNAGSPSGGTMIFRVSVDGVPQDVEITRAELVT